MSVELDYYAGTEDFPLALYLQDNDADALTDILVDALEDALRILTDETAGDTVH
ncbi:hypothetical protein [Pararhizobium sp.]|uniref:hypothetical protein n=1 Tax=Pararhizobium sp. TaxID=1977563 RepID=UPI00272259BF|nr:hypothetical protein [Pararhizobium sp.]MDO9418572.1 hypothetical protein [Pararhizobium sp.]